MGFTNDAEEEDLKMTTSYFYYFLSIPSPRQMAWPLILKDIVYQIRMKSKMQKVKKRWKVYGRHIEKTNIQTQSLILLTQKTSLEFLAQVWSKQSFLNFY